MADTVLSRRSFPTVVRPFLERLTDELGEASVAGVLEGVEMVNIGHVSGAGELRVGRSLGERWPVHVSASGKAILAFMDDRERASVLDRCTFDAFTPDTIVDRSRFERELDLVRNRGWATMVGERTPGVTSIGVPVFDRTGSVVGAIGIVGWSARYDDAFIGRAAERLMEVAAQISSELGFASRGAGPGVATAAEVVS
jgi:DNA-binding IclR family transcriptional regulator